MKNKTVFSTPEIEILTIALEDILTASVGQNGEESWIKGSQLWSDGFGGTY